jgi:uncharacterized membrane protein
MANAIDAQPTSATRSGGIFSATNVTYVVLALAIGVSGYLTYLKYAAVDAVCLAGSAFDCGTVLNSVYSEIGGVPIAALGLATNLVVLALLLLQNRVGFLREYGTLLIFGVLLFATIYSVYLVYLQAFVILAYCQWCLTHEALVFIMFGIWAVKAYRELASPAT